MAFQDVADGLVAHRIAEVGEGPGDAVVAPVTVVGGDPDNQLRNRSIHAGPRRASRRSSASAMGRIRPANVFERAGESR